MRPNPFRFRQLIREIPMVARLMLVGLVLISAWVVWQFLTFIAEPENIRAGEDFFIHVAMLILVPLATLGLFLICFGYAYYQICKRNKIKPYWENWK